jgi:hypothetical protein
MGYIISKLINKLLVRPGYDLIWNRTAQSILK